MLCSRKRTILVTFFCRITRWVEGVQGYKINDVPFTARTFLTTTNSPAYSDSSILISKPTSIFPPSTTKQKKHHAVLRPYSPLPSCVRRRLPG